MPLAIEDGGRDNRVEADPACLARIEGALTFAGSGARIMIREPFAAHSLHLLLGDGSCLEIAEGCHLGIVSVHAPREGTVRIGAGASFNGQTRFLLHEPGRIEVGAACLFGPDIDLTVSDMHAVVDLATGERINPARDVAVGERVWLGIGTFVAKGAAIGSGSVVGARSFVNGPLPPNCLAAGAPARVLRTNVSWRFDLT